MEMYQYGVEVTCLPDHARCELDEEGRNPLNMEKCPLNDETCSDGCFYYTEEQRKVNK